MQEVVRFWVARGADGFRLDAIDRLAKDPELRDDPPSDEPFGLPLLEHELGRDLRHSRNAEWIGEALGAIREAAGDALLIGEVYLPAAQARALPRAPGPLVRVRADPVAVGAGRGCARAIAAGAAVEGRSGPGAAWALSNHDFGRFPHALRPRERARRRAAADDAAGHRHASTRATRSGRAWAPAAIRRTTASAATSFRHPMQWDAHAARRVQRRASRGCPLVDPAERNVADQREDPGSLLSLLARADRAAP